MKKSVLKTCSMVFAALCLIGFVVLLCSSVTLPYTETYRVWGSTYTQHYSGSFDASALPSLILTAFGAFWGFVLFFSIPCESRKKEEKAETVNPDSAENGSGCGSC